MKKTSEPIKAIEADILLSPMQAVRLMALSEMLRKDDLSFRGHDDRDEQDALSLMADIAQEIALQMGGYASPKEAGQ